jgi:hypothetical protein
VEGKNLLGLLGPLIRVRDRIFGAAFATFISPQSALVLLSGLFGAHGHGILTGLFLSLTTALILLLTFRYDLAVSALDYIFVGLVVAIFCSVLSNGVTAEPKEYALLILTLSAYPACRFIRASDLTRGRETFVCFQSILALSGAAATLIALIVQTSGLPKPTVFGVEGAAIQFVQPLCYLIFSTLIMWRLTTFATFMLSLFFIIPIAIFAAALVRFSFVALVGTLIVAAYMSGPWQRRNILLAVAAIVLSIAAGFASRSAHVVRFAVYAVGGEQTFPAEVLAQRANQPAVAPTGPPSTPAQGANQAAAPEAGPVPTQRSTQAATPKVRAPSCSSDANVNLHNSIAIRKVLLLDAAFMLPSTGLFGHGLDSYMKETCLAGHQMHNSILQAFVEFGWLGGLLFTMLVIKSLWSIMRAAKDHTVSRFVFCCLTFTILICLVHGRYSREAVLFAFLGGVASITQPARTRSRVVQTVATVVSR